ncbi:hypothetical protein Glove_212g20 [Diversispora epigaea]|uniref:Uncharacterized protein n=1 Tax=Diversispora epigaea TaxID=1348612 RepID=A0A397IRJ2_9GLOM|nr:hypothetical protein Glove_212g20 [Diversispora epigaea]
MLLSEKAQKLDQFSKIRHHDILVDQLTALYFIDIDYRLFKQKLASIQKSYKRLHKENLHSVSSSSSPPSPLLADQIMLHLINAALEQIDKKHLEYFEKQFKKSSGGKRFAMLLSKLRLKSQLLFKSMIIWVKELIFGKIVGGIKEFFYKIGQALREPHYNSRRNNRRHDNNNNKVQPEFDEKKEYMYGDDNYDDNDNYEDNDFYCHNRRNCCEGEYNKCTECMREKEGGVKEECEPSEDIFTQLINDLDVALKEVKFEFFFNLKYHELFVDQLILLQMLDPNYDSHSHNSHNNNNNNCYYPKDLKDEFSQELKDHYEDYKHRELLEQQEEFEIKRTEVEEGYKDFISSLQSLSPQLCNENNIVRNKLNSQQLFLLRSRKNSFSHSRESSSFSFGMTSMSSTSNSTTSTPTTTTFAPITPITTNFTNITPFSTPTSSSITNKSTSQICSSSPISTTFNINPVTINTTNLSNISSFNSNTTTPTTARTDSYNNIFDSPIFPTFDTPRSSIYTTNTTTNTSSSFKEGFLTFTSADWFLLVLVKVTGQYIEEQLDLLNMTEEEEAQWVEFRKLYQLMVGLFHSVTEQ